MQIDWFTLAAQIVNFLILLVLLRQFLFKPVLGIMDERERKIAARLKSAEDKHQQAEQESQKYQEKQRELDERRDEELNRAKEAAEQKKKELIREARQKVAELRDQWQQSLAHEQEEFADWIRREIGAQVCAVSRRLLSELSDEDLEAQIIQMFIDRLADVDQQQLREMVDTARDADEGIQVISSFELPKRQRQDVEKAIEDIVPESVALTYKTDSDLICGVELRSGAHSLSWSIVHYLEELEQQFAEAVQRTQQGDREESKTHQKAEDAESDHEARNDE